MTVNILKFLNTFESGNASCLKMNKSTPIFTVFSALLTVCTAMGIHPPPERKEDSKFFESLSAHHGRNGVQGYLVQQVGLVTDSRVETMLRRWRKMAVTKARDYFQRKGLKRIFEEWKMMTRYKHVTNRSHAREDAREKRKLACKKRKLARKKRKLARKKRKLARKNVVEKQEAFPKERSVTLLKLR